MAESREKEGVFGKYTEHLDDEGNKVGESRERDGVFGKYTEHTDAQGSKVGESREKDGVFGRYTEHTDSSGSKTSESRDKDGIWVDTPSTEIPTEPRSESRETRRAFSDPIPSTQGQVGLQDEPRP